MNTLTILLIVGGMTAWLPALIYLVLIVISEIGELRRKRLLRPDHDPDRRRRRLITRNWRSPRRDRDRQGHDPLVPAIAWVGPDRDHSPKAGPRRVPSPMQHEKRGPQSHRLSSTTSNDGRSWPNCAPRRTYSDKLTLAAPLICAPSSTHSIKPSSHC
jgi:hypothetical protein